MAVVTAGRNVGASRKLRNCGTRGPSGSCGKARTTTRRARSARLAVSTSLPTTTRDCDFPARRMRRRLRARRERGREDQPRSARPRRERSRDHQYPAASCVPRHYFRPTRPSRAGKGFTARGCDIVRSQLPRWRAVNRVIPRSVSVASERGPMRSWDRRRGRLIRSCPRPFGGGEYGRPRAAS